MIAKAVHGTALDKVFNGPLVQLSFSHPLQKFFQRPEGAALIAFADHGSDQPMTHILHSSQAESNRVPLYHKMVVGMVDIRGQGLNPHLLAFGNIPRDLLRGIQHRGHQGSHILPGIVAFQVCRLISYHGVANRMSLIESIIREVHDFIVYGLGYRLRDTMADTAADVLCGVSVDKNLSLRLNDLHFLL